MARPADTAADSNWRRAIKAGSLIRSGRNTRDACRLAGIPVMTFNNYLGRSLASEYGVAIRAEMRRADAAN